MERLDALIWRFLLDIQVEIFSGQLGFRKRVKAGNINLGVISIWTIFKAWDWIRSSSEMKAVCEDGEQRMEVWTPEHSSVNWSEKKRVTS